MNVIILGSSIQKVEHNLYSHCTSDHTMGMRVVEQLKMDWLANSLGKKPDNPIEVASLPAILADIKKQGTKYGSYNVLCNFVSLIFSLIRVRNALWEDITQGKL